MEYVIVFALGMLTATLLIRWLARRAIDKFMDQLSETVEEKTEAEQMRVDLEFEQNIYLLYNSDDGSFVAQGNDLQDLRNNLRSRFPNRTVTIVKGNPEVMQQLRDQLKDPNENSHSVGSPS